MDDDVHRVPLADEQLDGVGELVFTAFAAVDAAQRIEDRAVQQVTAHGDESRRRFFRRRLLHHAAHALDVRCGGAVGALLRLLDVEDAVVEHVLARQLQRAQHGSTVFGAHGGHPLHHAEGQHQVVGEHDGHGLFVVVEKLLGDQHRMPQPQGLFLDHAFDGDDLGGAVDLVGDVVLAALAQRLLQVGAGLEVPQHAVLARRGDHGQAGGAGGGGFLGDHLDAGRVHHGQQFLRHRLRGRQEPRAHAGGGDDHRACGITSGGVASGVVEGVVRSGHAATLPTVAATSREARR